LKFAVYTTLPETQLICRVALRTPSLHPVNEYRPPAISWGEFTATVCCVPAVQGTLHGAVSDVPSRVTANPDGDVATENLRVAKIAVTDRGAFMSIGCGFVDPDKSPLQPEKPAEAVSWTIVPAL